VRASVHPACSFYFPPKDILPIDEEMAEKLGMGYPGGSAGRTGDALPKSPSGDYGPFEMDAIGRLEHEAPGGRERSTSKALYRVLSQMAASPDAVDAYRRDARTYVSLFGGLTSEEKAALTDRSAAALHGVALQIVRSGDPVPAPMTAMEQNVAMENHVAVESHLAAEQHVATEQHVVGIARGAVTASGADAGELHDAEELHDAGELHDAKELHDAEELHDAGELHDAKELHDAEELHDAGELHDAKELHDAEELHDAAELHEPDTGKQ
jgi:hypothetical protein